MRGVKPYMNATGKVFTIYECVNNNSSTNSDFDAGTVMGAMLLGIHDQRIDELDKVLYELTRSSEKISSRKRTNTASNLPIERDDKKGEIKKPVKDKDDRLIYTYRPFKELINYDGKVRSNGCISRIRK